MTKVFQRKVFQMGDSVNVREGLETVGSKGCVRQINGGRGSYELMSPFVSQADALLFEWGSINRGERNWEKGCPFSRCIQSMERHIAKFKMREADKEHDDNLAAIRFWAGAIIHYKEMIKRGILSDDLDDMPHYDSASIDAPARAESDKIKDPIPSPIGQGVLKIYVAGPITGRDDAERKMNCTLGEAIGRFIENKGHLVFTPHNYEMDATHDEYETFMSLDFSILRDWAEAIYVIHPSPGTNREVKLAKELGLQIFSMLSDVPFVTMVEDLRKEVEK